MSDLRKAAEMALDALHNIDQSNNYDAIEALRQALAQPEQEPLVWMNKYGHVSSEQTEEYNAPLYTAPPKREWQGLTDEERVLFFTKSKNKFWDWDDGVDIEAFIRAIEAKLKEKNGG